MYLIKRLFFLYVYLKFIISLELGNDDVFINDKDRRGKSSYYREST